MTQISPIEWRESSVPVDSLQPYEKNPRDISEADFERLKASLREMGYHQRILCQPDLKVIGGHQRIKALKELGIETVRVLIPNRPLTAEEFSRLLVQDNLPFGTFDFKALARDFSRNDLKAWGMPKEWLGKVPRDIDDAAEELPPVPAVAISQTGDLWRLDGHRIICGDSTDTGCVSALLESDRPHLMVTDPPYGVEYDADFRNKIKREDGSIVSARAVGKVLNDDQADWRGAWALFPGEVAYVWHASLKSHIVAESLIATGFDLRANIIWAKNQIAIGRGHYHWQHEPCWYVVRDGGTAHWAGDRKQSTVWSIDKPSKSETGHSTQKPIECMRRPILNNSAEGDFIYDPFLGSGTTVIAAEQTGRKCLGIEINPAYIDLIIRRWETLTGKKAIHAATGCTFDETAKSRS